MQSSMAVAGMDALCYPCENILTRRANQWHYSIIAPFAKRPWPCTTTGSSSAIAGKKSLPTIEVAPARRSCIGSPQRRVASRVAEPRALSDARARGDIDVNTVPDLDKATALERDESSSRSIFLFEHDLRANASRLSRGKTGSHFSGSCSSAKTRFALLPGHDGSNIQGAERLLDCGQRLLRSGMFMSSILSSRTGSSTAQARFGSTLTLK